MIDNLFQLFNSIYPMSAELQHVLAAEFEIVDVPANHFLLKEKAVNSNAVVLLNGVAKSYYIDNADKEVCTRLMIENHIVVSVTSFFNQEPAYENIVTVTPSTIAAISFEALQKMYKQYLELNFIIRRITELYFLQSEQRIRLLRLGTAEEKYEYFLNNFPSLIDKVPQYSIASFLSITPETLSRVRHKLATKKV
ncbi:MAG: Crp/Fnr family transcriptional regulator [Ferruginibacter sp.]|nr:Crp/Fnr family transcriptional regulator [Ferruginibacter sp.]